MGTVVSVIVHDDDDDVESKNIQQLGTTTYNEKNDNKNDKNDSFVLIALDDGTSFSPVTIITPNHMIRRIKCEVGQTLDCIVDAVVVVVKKADDDKNKENNKDSDDMTSLADTNDSKMNDITNVDEKQDGNNTCNHCTSRSNSDDDNNSDDVISYTLHAHQLAVVHDHNAEQLRWMELAFINSCNQQQDKDDEEMLTMEYGFPQQKTFHANDLLSIIQSDFHHQQQQQQEQQQQKQERRKRQHQLPNNSNSCDSTVVGVSLSDLVLCLDHIIDEDSIIALIQELQLSGQIYCNKHGNYVPL